MTELGARIDAKINAAKMSTTSSRERRRVLSYYNRTEPKPQHPRQATYITTDVYDAIEGLKAQVDDTLNVGREILEFAPMGPDDYIGARIATAYTNHIFYRANDGRKIVQTVVDDGLKGTNAYVKVYWKKDVERREESFENVPYEAAAVLSSGDDIEDFEADSEVEFGPVSGTLTRIVADRSKPVIELIAPEDFGIDPRAVTLDDAFHYVRSLMTKSELRDAGFDISKLKDVSPDGPQIGIEDSEADARFERVDGGSIMRGAHDSAEDTPYWVYECYDRLTPKGGKRGLYKITRVAGITLDIEEVDRSPVKVFTPMPIAHSFHGGCFGALMIPIQNARTTLMRAILDHSALATNPRYMVVKGGLPNPRELLNGQFGGIVNVESPQAVMPLEQPNLNQFVFPTLDMLKGSGEQTTGLSMLSVGQNADVISNQNSRGMVQDQVDLAMTKQRMVIRNLAYGFLRDVFLELYQLALENGAKTEIQDVAGEWVDVDPRRFIERKSVEVVLHLTPSDAQAEAVKFTGLATMGMSNPDVARMMAPKMHNLVTKIMQVSGIKNVGDYIVDPAQLPPAKPDPMAVAQLEIAQQQAQAGLMAAQATLMKAQTDQAHKQHADELASIKAERDQAKTEAETFRKMIETGNRIDVAQQELEMNRQLAKQPDQVRGISSPSL